jgi:chorismate mutase
MPVIDDIRSQLTRIDRSLLDLLKERCRISWEYQDSSSPDSDYEEELLEMWLEEGGEHGMNEARMERICKAICALSRKQED